MSLKLVIKTQWDLFLWSNYVSYLKSFEKECGI